MSNITDALPISKKDIINLLNAFMPKGMIAWFDLDEAPEGWTVYEPLIGKYPLGANTSIGSEVTAGLPNITGKFISADDSVNVGDGAFEDSGTNVSGNGEIGGSTDRVWTFDASRSNAVYGKSDTVTPPSVKLLPCIKL